MIPILKGCSDPKRLGLGLGLGLGLRLINPNPNPNPHRLGSESPFTEKRPQFSYGLYKFLVETILVLRLFTEMVTYENNVCENRRNRAI